MGIANEKIRCHEVDIVDFAHTAAVTAWKPIYVKGFGALIPITSALANARNAFAKRGRFSFAIATSITISKGDEVFYDTAADKVVVIRPTTGFFIGIAADDGTAAGGEVQILLNETTEPLKYGITVVTDAVDTAPTLTATQVLGGIIKATPTAGRAHTLPTAANLLAALPGAKVGSEVRLTFVNAAAATHAVTITDSTSITNGGVAAHATVAAATSQTIRIVFTNVTANSEAAIWYLE